MLKKLFNKNKKNNSEVKDYKEKSYKDYYEILRNPDFVSYNEIFNLTLLETNTMYSEEFIKLVESKNNQALENHLEMVYKFFVVSWNKNLRFSMTKLVPNIKSSEASTVDSVNFFQTEPKTELFFKTFNSIIEEFVLENNRPVEFFPGIILYLSKETQKLKIAFNDQVIK